MALQAFIEKRLPDGISYGATGGPMFKSNVFTATSGVEQRSLLWSKSRAEYDISYAIRDITDMDIVLKFFYEMRGKLTGFRFKDWADYTLVDEVIATGNAAQTVFPITKTYATGLNGYVRDIFKINTETLTPIVKLDATVQTVTTHYTIDEDLGTITFVTPPGSGVAVKITAEFDVPVRFDNESLPITQDSWGVESTNAIKLVEIKMVR